MIFYYFNWNVQKRYYGIQDNEAIELSLRIWRDNLMKTVMVKCPFHSEQLELLRSTLKTDLGASEKIYVIS
jgi:hypothetical protein